MKLSRRNFLKAVGASLALPYLEAMGQTAPPKRLLFVYGGTGGAPRNPAFPNVLFPATPGSLTVTEILQPLQLYRDRLLLLGGVDNLASWKGPMRNLSGGGHTSAKACNLTGRSHGGQSIDQAVADRIGGATRIRSLSFAHGYTHQIPFWVSQNVQAPFDNDSCALFTKVFGRAPGAPPPTSPVSHVAENRRSVLDALTRSTADLKRTLGRTDQQTLDGYLESVRAVERRNSVPVASCTAPTQVDCSRDELERFTFFDTVALSLACGVTRVATISLAPDANRLPEFGFPLESWHDDVEHRAHDTEEKMRYVILWQQWIMRQIKRMADILAATPDGAGSTVLDNTLIVFTNELSHAGSHIHDNMPYLLLGGRAFDSAFRFGRYTRFTGASNNQLFASIHNAFSPTPITQFGDAEWGTGTLSGLT